MYCRICASIDVDKRHDRRGAHREEAGLHRDLRARARAACPPGAAGYGRAEKLYAMAGFRNILVHGYQDVDLRVVEDIVENHLTDLLAFVAAIRAVQL
jgi:hypothetical protein